MIELEPHTAFMAYLGLTLLALLGIWVYHHFKKKNKKILSNEQQLFVCEYCHFVYLNDLTKKITQCPQCSAYNKVKK